MTIPQKLKALFAEEQQRGDFPFGPVFSVKTCYHESSKSSPCKQARSSVG
jgi:hypothetical protein